MNTPRSTTPKEKSRTSLFELRSRIPAPLISTFDSVVSAAGIKSNCVGLMLSINQICQDLVLAKSHGIAVDKWLNELEGLRLVLLRDGLDLSTDLAQSKTIRLIRIDVLIATPEPDTPPATTLLLQAVRGLVFLKSISYRKALTHVFAKNYLMLVKSCRGDFARLKDSLSLDLEELKIIREKFPPKTSQSNFLTEVIAALSYKLPDPINLDEGTRARIIASNAVHNATDTKLKEKANKKYSQTSKQSPPAEINLIELLLRQSRFSSPRENSGIAFNWDSLHPIELENLFQIISKDLQTEQPYLALAIFLVLFIRFSPFYFHHIPLCESTDKLWLDVKNGYLAWPLSLVTKLKGKGEAEDCIRTALPAEITLFLQRLKGSADNPESLADLFPVKMKQLKKQIRKYLRVIDAGSHRPTIQRITNSCGIHLLHICLDETIASVLSRDFRIGTSPSLNYFTCKAERFDELLSQSYKRLGLSGKHSPSFTVTSRRLIDDKLVDEMLTNALSNAKLAFETLPNNCSFRKVSETLNTISIATYLLLIFSVGGRTATECGISLHTIDLQHAICLLNDKIISHYHISRVAPLIPIVVQWLKFYLDFLRLVAYRLQARNKKLAGQIAWMRDHPNSRAPIPLFLRLGDNDEVSPLGSGDLAEIFCSYGMERNAGRHYVDHVLREAEVGSATLMAMQGRGGNGQEAFGSRSALSPMTILSLCRSAINNKFSTFNLPLPPKVSSRRCQPGHHDFPAHHLQNWQRADSYIEKSPFELCPFHEFTLAYAQVFVELQRAWLKSRIKVDVGDLVLGLSLRDGVCLQDELIAAANEALNGRINRVNGEHFVDTNTEKLGIRRTRLERYIDEIARKILDSVTNLNEVNLIVTERIKTMIEVPPSFEKNGLG